MYSKTSESTQQEQLINRYAPLVKRIAYHLLARLPASVQVEDLMQAGMIGLLEASRKYDAGQGRQLRDLRRHPHPRRHARRGPQGRLGATLGAPQHAHGHRRIRAVEARTVATLKIPKSRPNLN